MTPDEIKAVNDDAVAEIVVEISERHHPRLHLGTPCPTWGCCECGAEGGCEAGLLLKILHDGQTDLAAAVAERDRLRAALEPLVEFVDAVTAIDAHYASGHPNMTPEMAQAWPGVCERAQAARAALAGQTAGGGGGKKNGGE